MPHVIHGKSGTTRLVPPRFHGIGNGDSDGKLRLQQHPAAASSAPETRIHLTSWRSLACTPRKQSPCRLSMASANAPQVPDATNNQGQAG